MIVEIKRCTSDKKQYVQQFRYDGELHRSVAYLLDTLNYNDDLVDIDGKKSRRIVWECSCRQKQCGSCAMLINGVPALACSTFLDECKIKKDTLTLAPLSKFPVIEDLRVDRSVIFDSMKDMNLWLEEKAEISENHYYECYDTAKCLKCGLCLEVCPNWKYPEGSLTRFAGAPAVAEGFRAVCQGAEVKDDIKRHFLDGCSKSGACSKICPINMNMLSLTAMLSGRKFK